MREDALHMKVIERYSNLMCSSTVEDWSSQIFNLARDLGYEQTLLAILPNPHAPAEAEFAFLHSNYSHAWRSKYDAEKLQHVDPTFTHCMNKSVE